MAYKSIYDAYHGGFMSTVRVKVFVSVNHEGDWLASGGLMKSERQVRSDTLHVDGDAGYWIEADLPIPDESPGYNVKVTKAD